MISVCIPTYNKKGTQHSSDYNNLTMLIDLLTSLKNQTFKDFEVVISDHSTEDDIKNLVEGMSDILDIKYHRYTEKYGSPEANLNNAMKLAKYDIIKPIYQDDYFLHENSLQTYMEEFSKCGKKWMIAGCTHISENNKNILFNNHIPIINDRIQMLLGVNRFGSPSTMMFNKNDLFFDENLIWLSDVEYYYRMMEEFGDPYLSSNLLVVSRLRQDGITNTDITNELIEEEKKYCYDKNIKKETLNLSNYKKLKWQ